MYTQRYIIKDGYDDFFLNVNMSIYRRILKYILASSQYRIIYGNSKELGSSVHTNMERFLKNRHKIYVYVMSCHFCKNEKKKTPVCS